MKYRTMMTSDVDQTLSTMAAEGWRLVAVQSPPLYDARTQKLDPLNTRLYFELAEPAPFKSKGRSDAKPAAV